MSVDAGADDIIPYERSRADQAWARWLARGADSVLILPIVIGVFAALGGAVALGRLPPEFVAWADSPLWATVVELAVTFLLFALWEPLFISNTGTTPGKWIMGVGLRAADGRKVGFFTALGRFVWVWAAGLGFYVPLLSLICALIARSRLISDGVTVWDEKLELQVTHKRRHPLLWTVVIIIVLSINVGFAVLSRMSP